MSVLINSNGVRHNSGAVEGVPDVAPSPERTTREPSDRAVHHVVAVDEAIDVDEGNPPCCMKFEPWFEAKVEPHVLVPKTRKNWITFAIFWSCVVGIAVWFSVWAFPKIIDNAFDPGVEWFRSITTKVQLGVVCCIAIWLFPVTILLPKDPFIWVVAVVFSFGEAFAIVFVGTTAGMALPYVITRKWFRRYILRFLTRYKYTKAMLMGVRSAGPFKTVLVFRLGPVPYSMTNYLMAVPRDVSFLTYMAASTPGKLPSTVLSVLFGRNLKGLAALLQGKSVPASQIVVNFVSLGCAILIVGGGWYFARRELKKMEAAAEAEDEAAAAAAAAAVTEVPETGPGHKPEAESSEVTSSTSGGDSCSVAGSSSVCTGTSSTPRTPGGSNTSVDAEIVIHTRPPALCPKDEPKGLGGRELEVEGGGDGTPGTQQVVGAAARVGVCATQTAKEGKGVKAGDAGEMVAATTPVNPTPWLPRWVWWWRRCRVFPENVGQATVAPEPVAQPRSPLSVKTAFVAEKEVDAGTDSCPRISIRSSVSLGQGCARGWSQGLGEIEEEGQGRCSEDEEAEEGGVGDAGSSRPRDSGRSEGRGVVENGGLRAEGADVDPAVAAAASPSLKEIRAKLPHVRPTDLTRAEVRVIADRLSDLQFQPATALTAEEAAEYDQLREVLMAQPVGGMPLVKITRPPH